LGDIGIAGKAELALMGIGGKSQGAFQQSQVGLRMMGH
jgi:hypothetical protein